MQLVIILKMQAITELIITEHTKTHNDKSTNNNLAYKAIQTINMLRNSNNNKHQ